MAVLSQAWRIHVPVYQESRNQRHTVCPHCFKCIKKNSFATVPLFSFANRTWIGAIPPELQGLLFVEEQCIALARATKTIFKLRPGPTGQYTASGNVCILPQDPCLLPNVLPPSLDTLFDEVAVILLRSTHDPVTEKVC